MSPAAFPFSWLFLLSKSPASECSRPFLSLFSLLCNVGPDAVSRALGKTVVQIAERKGAARPMRGSCRCCGGAMFLRRVQENDCACGFNGLFFLSEQRRQTAPSSYRGWYRNLSYLSAGTTTQRKKQGEETESEKETKSNEKQWRID